MARPWVILLLAVLVFLSGFESIHSEMDVIEGADESSSDCGKILTSVLMSQKQLDKVDVIVQSITPNLKDNIELGYLRLLQKIEHLMENKLDELDKKIDIKFHETKTHITAIEDKISEYTTHVDSKIDGLESRLTHALNVSATINNNNACCKLCSETTALVKNTTTGINDINIRNPNVSVNLQGINETVQNFNDIVTSNNKNITKQNDTTVSTEAPHKVPEITNKNITKQNDTTVSTEAAHKVPEITNKNITKQNDTTVSTEAPHKVPEITNKNITKQNDTTVSTEAPHKVPEITNKNITKQNDTTVSTEAPHKVPEITTTIATITTTELNKPAAAASKCDSSQQMDCCSTAYVQYWDYSHYIELSARGRHTAVTMTSAGLQEYTMYFAVRGVGVYLLLTPTSPWSNLYYVISFSNYLGGRIFMWELLPTVGYLTIPHDLYTSNIISTVAYNFYYVTISGNTLKVGRRGEAPLITHYSTELSRLRYFSFTRWGSLAGEALYDCTAE